MVSGEGIVSGEGWSLVRGGLWRGVVSARGGLCEGWSLRGVVSGEGWSLVRGGLWRGVDSGEGWSLVRDGLW